jgi:hypothetical protein
VLQENFARLPDFSPNDHRFDLPSAEGPAPVSLPTTMNALVDRLWKRLLWIAALAALAYMPSLLRLTYYRDDWYYAYDALVGPSGVFRFMFAEDRPVRGPFFDIYHNLFGIAPTPYHLATFFWRVVGGAAAAWLFHLLWPRRPSVGLAAGALFALYPGFTWWVQGIEYQPMVASAALMVVSLALTVLAIRLGSGAARIASIAAAIVSGWLYLALVEYAAGMELLRILLIFLVIHEPSARGLRSRLAVTLRAWLYYLIIPAGFLIWRFLLFTSARKATDLGAQLGGVLADPLTTSFRWLIGALLSVINVTLTAWVDPLLGSFFSLSLRQQLLGLSLAILAGALAYWLLTHLFDSTHLPADSDDGWQLKSVWLGLAALLLAIAPVIIANRQITLPRFSHYALPASLGVAFLFVGVVGLLSNRRLQAAVLTLLIALGALTHQALGAAAVDEERTIAAFWHQVAWRAPSIAERTTLLVFYPGVDYGTDSDVVWGPANWIYYPDKQDGLPVRVRIAALTADRDALNSILIGKDTAESTYRSHTMSIDSGDVLLAIQSSSDSCVRFLDARWPTFSAGDDPALRSVAAASRVENIAQGNAPVPPAWLFGNEPVHGWCYYFERASLAAQQGDWPQVARLQDEAARMALHPNDQIEWMPFLQAQAYLGDLPAVKEIATRINTQKLYRQQACANLQGMPSQGYPLSPEMQAHVEGLFCGGQH